MLELVQGLQTGKTILRAVIQRVTPSPTESRLSAVVIVGLCLTIVNSFSNFRPSSVSFSLY